MDLNEIERILELMREHEILEVELEDPDKGMRLKLKKAGPPSFQHPVLTPAVSVPAHEMSMVPGIVAAPGPRSFSRVVSR